MNISFFPVHWRAYLLEFLGTFVIVFITCGAILVNNIYGDIGTVGIAFVFGLSYMAMMSATVHVSGGHLNPVVTLALWLARKISTMTFIFYLLFQILAGFAAGGLLLYIFGEQGSKFYLGGPVLGFGMTQQIALVIEATLAAILVFAYFATVVDRRGPVSFAPLVVGLVVVAESVFASQLTGAAINPARAIGPLVISRSYSDLVVFVLAGSLGSVIGVVYDLLFLKTKKK